MVIKGCGVPLYTVTWYWCWKDKTVNIQQGNWDGRAVGGLILGCGSVQIEGRPDLNGFTRLCERCCQRLGFLW